MDRINLSESLLRVPLYVGGRPIEEVQKEYGLERIIKLASNENPLGPSPLAVEAITEAMADVHRYPGVCESALSAKLAAAIDPDLDESNIIIGNGSCDILRMVCQGFLHEGGQSIMCAGTFPMFRIYTEMFGGEPMLVELREYAYDLPAMAAMIGDRTRLIFVCNPNNPTGTVLTQQQIDAFMGKVPEEVVVVFDQAYYDYVEAEEYAEVTKYIKQGRNVIAIRTFSKIHGLAGLRVGYGVAKKEMIEYLQHARSPFHVGSINLIGATASLDDAEHMRRSREVNSAGKAYLYEQLDRLDVRYVPSDCNFILLVDLEHDEQLISEALLRRGVIVRPTEQFGVARAIRATVGTREENEQLVSALEEAMNELEDR